MVGEEGFCSVVINFRMYPVSSEAAKTNDKLDRFVIFLFLSNAIFVECKQSVSRLSQTLCLSKWNLHRCKKYSIVTFILNTPTYNPNQRITTYTYPSTICVLSILIVWFTLMILLLHIFMPFNFNVRSFPVNLRSYCEINAMGDWNFFVNNLKTWTQKLKKIHNLFFYKTNGISILSNTVLPCINIIIRYLHNSICFQ